MKIIYLAQYIHPSPFQQDREWMAGEIEEFIRLNALSTISKIERLHPIKVFCEGLEKGETLHIPSNVRAASKHGDLLAEFAFKMAQEGVKVEGADSMSALSLYFACRRTERRMSLSLFESICKDKEQLVTGNKRKNVIPIFRMFSKATIMLLVDQLLTKLIDATTLYRDYVMGRWISKAADDGTNVIVCGADHNPLRFVKDKNIRTCSLLTPEDVKDLKKRMGEFCSDKDEKEPYPYDVNRLVH